MGPPGGPGTYVPTYALLRLIDATVFPAGYIAWVEHALSSADSGGGLFQYDPTATDADNGGTIIEPANTIGRWFRIGVGSSYFLGWWGTLGMGADETAKVQAAVDAVPDGGELLVPVGTFGVSATILRSVGTIKLTGQGSGGLLGLITFKALAGLAGNPLFKFTNTEGYIYVQGLAFNMNGVNGDALYWEGTIQQNNRVIDCRFMGNTAGYWYIHIFGTAPLYTGNQGQGTHIRNSTFASGSLGSAVYLENVSDRCEVDCNTMLVAQCPFQLKAPAGAACVVFSGNNIGIYGERIFITNGEQFKAYDNQVECRGAVINGAIFEVTGTTASQRGFYIGRNNLNGHSRVDYAVSLNDAIDGVIDSNTIGEMLIGEILTTANTKRIIFNKLKVISGNEGIGGAGASQVVTISVTTSGEYQIERPIRVDISFAGGLAAFFRNISATGFGTYMQGGGSDNTHYYQQIADFAGNIVANLNSQYSAVKAKLGYLTGVGAGGAVAQITSKATSVTLNKTSGQITMDAANLVAGTRVQFDVVCDKCDAYDTVMILHASGGAIGSYSVEPTGVVGGGFKVGVTNITGGDLAEAIVLTFNLFKGTIN